MVKILINGINGKMGKEVLNLANTMNDVVVLSGFDITSSNTNNFHIYNDINLIEEQPDVIIDFSTPSGTLNILEYAKSKHIPIVIATTGFNDTEQKQIEDYSKFIPIFKSSNMSYEISIMSNIVANVAKQLNDSDIEIIEYHHRNKVDSPSGTALMLANSINKSLNDTMSYTYDRHSIKQKRSDTEIGIHSVRGGTEVGKHTVLFLGENESFEITHTVTSRSIFAKGAIKAAKFIITKGNGLYDMNDLI